MSQKQKKKKAKAKIKPARSAATRDAPREQAPTSPRERAATSPRSDRDDLIPREPYTTGSLLSGTFTMMGALGWRGAAVFVASQIPLAVYFAMSDEAALARELWSLAQALPLGIVTALGLQHIQRRPVDLVDAVGVGFRKFPFLLLAGFIAQLVSTVMLLLLIVPGVLRYLSYLLIAPLLVSGEGRVIDVLELSRERMKGYRAAVAPIAVPLLFFSFLDIFAPGLLKDLLGHDQLAPTWLDIAYALGSPLVFYLPATALSLVLYAKLCRD